MPVSPPISTRANGQTIDQTWFNVLKTAADDHEDRLGILEGETFLISAPVVGLLDHLSFTYSGLVATIVQQDLIVMSGGIFVYEPGSAGTIECDWQYKRGAGSWTSIFSTRPTVLYSAGALASSSNGVIDVLNDELDADDSLRLNIHQIQTDIRGFTAFLKCVRNA